MAPSGASWATLGPILAYFGAVLPLLGPRGSKREAQERPRAAQGSPREAPERLIGSQECPRRAKERPKRAPESPKIGPRLADFGTCF